MFFQQIFFHKTTFFVFNEQKYYNMQIQRYSQTENFREM